MGKFKFEPFGKGFALAKRFHSNVNAPTLPYRIEIEVALEGDRFVCEAMRVERKEGGAPVTSEGIRKLPVGDLIRTAALGHVYRVEKNPKGRGVVITETSVSGFERFADDGPTEEALQYVALVYRLAYACNESPTIAIEEAFQLPRSTAERWVSKARDLGYIDISDPRRRSK
ncbi:MAG: hypothetical protein ACR2LG_03485 [Actinomycetota bacterium]